MKEAQPETYADQINDALWASLKVDEIIRLQYCADREDVKDFNPDASKIGLIVMVEPGDTSIEGTLSRSERYVAVETSYSKIPGMISDPKVIGITYCDKEIIKLLKESDSDEVVLTRPWSGPVDDEWDSGAYDEFWYPVEKVFQKKVELLQKVGKKVIVK